MTILILLTGIFLFIFFLGYLEDNYVVEVISGLILLFIIAIGWILLGNKLSNKYDITYITLKSIKDSTTYNSMVIYDDKVIKDDSYLLFIQDSMTIQKTLAYNMYGTVIYTNYKPIIK